MGPFPEFWDPEAAASRSCCWLECDPVDVRMQFVVLSWMHRGSLVVLLRGGGLQADSGARLLHQPASQEGVTISVLSLRLVEVFSWIWSMQRKCRSGSFWNLGSLEAFTYCGDQESCWVTWLPPDVGDRWRRSDVGAGKSAGGQMFTD